MKSLKAAAVVAGSLAVSGIAAPAFAGEASNVTPTSLNGALETITSQKSLDVRPLAHQSDSLDTENENSVLSTVKNATTTLNQQGAPARLLGGLPIRG
ncbi:hypothetical protein [Streptomyces chiangmaiensis]|uniref:Secreted protein n=1 Tax=Streptomyces chiangmaiensis TaxID=766497 RepID=A0ABU7FJ80_9ACTN|nr:hypothetical protein [Streptomyces chiangmaiensis]MED7824113.1 hypothetical protein [Streptomyces chiangmaiensis]